jgi:anti-anti-sigma factor
MPQEFKANVRRKDHLAIVDLAGEINSLAERGLDDAYTKAESYDTPVIVLNFTRVTYINSTGIAFIVQILSRARQSHRQVAVYGLNEHYNEIFQITRLADYMSIYPDEASVFAGVM